MGTIPDIARNLCPEFAEIFQSIEKNIRELRGRMTGQVRHQYPHYYPKLSWKFTIFTQLAVYRCVDLAESILDDWKNRKIGSSFIILRSLFETVALMFDSTNRAKLHCEARDFAQLNEMVEKLTFSTRLKEWQPFPATSILTIIDRVDKQVPGFRYHYDNLCEYTHPNHFALMGVYGDMPDEITCDLSFHTLESKNGVKIVFSILSATLETAYLSIQRFEDLSPEIRRIAEAYQEEVEKRGKH